MRTVVNISLPKQMAAIVEENVSSGKYASKSEFFRNLLRLWMEGEIVSDIANSRRELETGKGKLLKSLKELR